MPWRLMASILSRHVRCSLSACATWSTSNKLLVWSNPRSMALGFTLSAPTCRRQSSWAGGSSRVTQLNAASTYSAYGQDTEYIAEEYRVKQTPPKRYLQNSVSVTGRLLSDIVPEIYEDASFSQGRVFGTSRVEVQDGESKIELDIELWDDIVEPYQKQLKAGMTVIVYGNLAVGIKDQSLLIRSNRIDICVPYQQAAASSQLAPQTVYPSSSSTAAYNPQSQYTAASSQQGGYYNSSAPQPQRQNRKPTSEEIEAHWRQLFSNPGEFVDYRESKAEGRVKSRHPDFKDRYRGISLWLDSKGLPGWVMGRVPELDGKILIHRE